MHKTNNEGEIIFSRLKDQFKIELRHSKFRYKKNMEDKKPHIVGILTEWENIK
jgi:hypothetical protein